MEEIIAITAKNRVTRFDVMNGERFKCQVTLKLTPGMRYEYNIIKQMAGFKSRRCEVLTLI